MHIIFTVEEFNKTISHFQSPCDSVFQDESSVKPFHGNKFDLHGNEPVGGIHFHKNYFERTLVRVLRQRQRATRIWPIIPFALVGYELILIQYLSNVGSCKN